LITRTEKQTRFVGCWLPMICRSVFCLIASLVWSLADLSVTWLASWNPGPGSMPLSVSFLPSSPSSVRLQAHSRHGTGCYISRLLPARRLFTWDSRQVPERGGGPSIVLVWELAMLLVVWSAKYWIFGVGYSARSCVLSWHTFQALVGFPAPSPRPAPSLLLPLQSKSDKIGLRCLPGHGLCRR